MVGICLGCMDFCPVSVSITVDMTGYTVAAGVAVYCSITLTVAADLQGVGSAIMAVRAGARFMNLTGTGERCTISYTGNIAARCIMTGGCCTGHCCRYTRMRMA